MDYKDKIRKLLALAKSPEPEEAKFALLKARKLMAEHKLSERDLEERNTTVITGHRREVFQESKLVDGPALNRYWRKLLLLGVSMQN